MSKKEATEQAPLEAYNFPAENITVMASSLDDALQQLADLLSNNES